METRQITANIPSAYYDTIVTMFKGLGIDYNVKPKKAVKAPKASQPEPDSKEYILNSICQGMKEVRLWEQGKLKLPTLEEALNEL
ncbi:MAG: hypothetical protein IJ524_04420 [Bacteroidales bacterium]|nr:hypothetical protein [Bacteroidales bacterium]